MRVFVVSTGLGEGGGPQRICLPDDVRRRNGKRDFTYIMREREESKGSVANVPLSSSFPSRYLADLPRVEASPQAILAGIVCVAACTVENPGRLGSKKRRSH